MEGFYKRLKMASRLRRRSTGLSRGSDGVTGNISKIPITASGSHPPGYRSNSSTLTPSGHGAKTLAGLDNILRETYSPIILHQLNEDASPFWSAFNTSFTV